MKAHYRVVVIGGGVVGASVLYHLTKFGWTDVALVERSVLTAGSSWHAAGGFHALNANPNMALLQAYTIDLLKEVEAESGQSIGMHMTGGIHVASAPERWEWLQSSYRRFQAIGIDDVRLVTPEEIKARCPIISVDGVLGGMWADREGYVDTTGTVWAYAGAAKKRGATVIEHNRVLELKQRPELVLGPRHRGGRHQRRACGERRRPMGEAGRADGRARPSSLTVGASLPPDRDNPRDRFAQDRTADGRGPRGVHLHAPGSEGHADRHLRDPAAALVDGRRAMGLRGRAPAGEHRPHRRRTGARSPSLSGLADGRDTQMGQRRLHLLAGRQSARRPGRGQARLLARLRRHGRISARRRRRQVAGGTDDPRRGVDGHLRPRHRTLRRLRLQPRIHQADDRRVLRPPLRHDLSQRAIAGRPAAQNDAGLRRDDGRRLPLGEFLGTGDPALFRAGGI